MPIIAPMTEVRKASHQCRGTSSTPSKICRKEKRALVDDIKDVYGEAKGNGFDPKMMRKIVSMRRQDAEKRREEETILDLYLNALGMLD